MTLTVSLRERLREGIQTFLWSLKAERGLLGINLVACLVLFPLMTGMQLSHVREGVQNATIDWYQYNGSSALLVQGMAAAAIELLLILVLIGTLFSYMHSRRALDLLHAVPVGRVPMLLGRWGTSLVVVLLPLFVGCVLNDAVVAANGLAAQAGCTVGLFAKLALPLFAALSFSIFVCVCCGNTFNTILSIIVINLCWPMLLWLSNALLCNILPGFVDDSSALLQAASLPATLFSPGGAALLAPYLLISGEQGASAGGTLLYWLLFGVLVLVAAAVLYRRRKSESAESSFAFPVPKLVIQFLVSTAAALLGGMVLANVYPNLCLQGIALGGLLTFLLLEVIFSRGFHTMKKMLPALGIFVGAWVLVILCVTNDVTGFVTNVPQAADVSSVEVGEFGTTYYMTDVKEVDGRMTGSSHPVPAKVTEESEIQALANAHRSIADDFVSTHKPYTYGIINRTDHPLSLTYHLKNGKTLTRIYYAGSSAHTNENFVRITDLAEVRQSVFAMTLLEPEDLQSVYIFSRNAQTKAQSKKYTLTASEALELQQAILADEDVLKPYTSLFTGKDEKTADDYIEIDTTSNITPKAGSKLEKTLGTTEPVSFGTLNEELPPEAVHLRAFLKEKGILK
ncbi:MULTISPECIES: hypothetical protein [Caproicibacterium]|uniref:Uncharacterized protein n=1 Tax=Caproicibacterium argilliputei TaxID=3030016 RepID=A0AA97H0Q4_9FIRM|nr:hypothetical protein [Caproicibacterium argilliputei]WOC31786.1 hypothetical protein PXC00_11385 [Caproicibacterium argilliputei]